MSPEDTPPPPPRQGGVQNVPLTQGFVATVDGTDYESVALFRWKVLVGKRNVYAVRTVKKTRLLYMHRFLLRAAPETQVDHIDRNGLNNCRSNLRVSTPAQNHANQGKYRGTSRFKGVSWAKDKGKWRATIVSGRRQTFLGLFDREEEAALAYNVAARLAFGDFACLNVLECPALPHPKEDPRG